MKQKIVLCGAGGHGKVVADIIEKQGECEIVGFLDDGKRGEVHGYPILGRIDDIGDLGASGVGFAVATVGNQTTRKRLHGLIARSEMKPAVAVHPSAQIARGAEIGPGTVVMPGAVIGPSARLGRSCIVNTGATVDHDCVLADYVQIAPGAHIGGTVTVGEGTFIGIGAAVREGSSIGAWSVIGMGAVVVSDIPGGVVAYGVPAREVRKNPACGSAP